MKSFAFLALLSVTVAQTVAFSNCCKGALCGQKDDCPPCGTATTDGPACCDDEAPTSRNESAPCVHLEPSSEVACDQPESISSPEFVDLSLAELEGSPGPVAHRVLSRKGSDPPERPPADVPLFLRDQAFLI